MARFRLMALVILALTVTTAQTGRSEEPKPGDNSFAALGAVRGIQASLLQEHTCVIYKLDELGDDLELGKWIAETIPEVIAPGTWKDQGVLRYYGPKKILVVYHTPAVQAKVDGFLKSMKKSKPAEKAKTLSTRKPSAREQTIVPAQYRAPALLKTSNPVPEQNPSYPVAAPVRQPKHLFHFIIRYEGDGIIDDNVVKFMKAQYQSEKSKSRDSQAVPTTVPSGYNTAPVSATPPSVCSPAPVSSTSYPPAVSLPPTTSPVVPSVPLGPPSAKKEPGNKKAEKEKKPSNPFE